MNAITFLGHLVDKHGIHPMPSKVKAIQDFPEPIKATDQVKAMERFLGMINYYHRFIPHAAEIMKPLYDAMVLVHDTQKNLTSGRNKLSSKVFASKRRPKRNLVWSNKTSRAFKAAKTALANATMLHHPVEGASDIAMGAVLEQHVKGVWQPLTFFSQQFKAPQRKYSTFDRELLAIHP